MRQTAPHTDSATGSDGDHVTDGWFVDGYDHNPQYEYEGYIQFNADMGVPTLYPAPAGGPGDYVYFAPATKGSDGNPFEVGLATEPDWPHAGKQHLFIFDWANAKGNSPCDQPGYPPCVGFAPYAPSIDSTFISKYVRVLSHGVPEWSIETLQSGGYWYFAIFNYKTHQWEYHYSERYMQIRHNFDTGLNGYGGGHGYFEYYLPPNTACASADPSNPSSANTYETDARQYSATTHTWTRISAEKHLTFTEAGGRGVCFVGTNTTPYFTLSTFGDGWSNWNVIWR